MLDLRRLRYFLCVAEELHFGRAAQRLHLAQPPLTRQISTLERELGFRLFERNSRTVALTAQGLAFVPYARTVLEQVERARLFADQLASGTAGQLTLGYASSIALCDLFSQSLQAFAQRYPHVQLNLLEGASSHQWAQIVEGRIDIGLSRMQPPDGQADLQVLSLGEEPLVVALPSADPLACQAQVRLEQLGERPLILFPQGFGSGLNEIVEHLYRRHHRPLHRGPSGRQITSIIALVAAGQGIALVPRCTQTLARSGVAYRPLIATQATAPLLVLTRKHGRGPLVQAFMRVLEELRPTAAPSSP